MAVSPDGAHVAVSGQPSLLELWQLDPLQVAAVAEDVEANILFDVAFQEDGRFVSADNDGHLVLWQVDGGKLVPEALPSHEDAVRAVALDGSGRRPTAAGLDGLLTLWNAEAEPSTDLRLEGHAGAIHELAFAEEQGSASVAGEAWTAFALRWDFDRPCTWLEAGLWRIGERPGTAAPSQCLATSTCLIVPAPNWTSSTAKPAGCCPCLFSGTAAPCSAWPSTRMILWWRRATSAATSLCGISRPRRSKWPADGPGAT